jgi:hypothetical protein
MNDLALSEETGIAPSEVFMDGTSITEIDLESTCNEIIQRLNETSDTSEIEQAVTNLNGVEKFAARAKSKLIYAWSQWYKQVNKLDDFPKWFTQKFGGEELTVQKHQAIGELLMSDEVPDSVKQMNTKELVSVARAKQSGYDLSDVWDELAHSGSEGEVNAVVRRVKNKPERQGTLNLSLQPDGTITAWMGDSMVSLGWLNLADRDDEDTPAEKRKILEIGISRITNNSRMKIR